MSIITDLHVHSRFSRACSTQITIKNLEKWAKVKGLDLLGTGDFTFKKWYDEILEETKEDENGILKTKTGFPFIWQTEICLMYSQGGKGRRIHFVMLAPNKETICQITDWLKTKGRVDYDGRPIFNLSCVEFTEKMMEINEDIEIIPAHAWTSWFGIFGSKTGFNSLKEAFQDKVDKIHAIETGMSSDPEMNWRIKELNEKTIVSFSDLHSFWPWRMGREATAFNLKELSYKNIIDVIRQNKIDFTIETNPAYGKYHFDGHRVCNFSCSPQETKKLNGICPKCKKPLTIGVEYRVEELTNQDIKEHKNKKLFYKLLPLHEIISVVSNSGISSKKTWKIYYELINKFKNEFNILLNVSKEELINEKIDKKLIEYILLNRGGKIKVKPGYDGVYGVPILDGEKQISLSDS